MNVAAVSFHRGRSTFYRAAGNALPIAGSIQKVSAAYSKRKCGIRIQVAATGFETSAPTAGCRIADSH